MTHTIVEEQAPDIKATAFEAVRWASTEFGRAALGDKRLDARLVQIAAAIAQSPGGRIAEVFKTAAEREATYRFIENERIDSSVIAQSTFTATAERSAPHRFVFVPVDGSTLSPVQQQTMCGYGPVGTSKTKTQGLESYNAIALAPDGTPLGLAGQLWWSRPDKALSKAQKAAPRHVAEKETQYWLDTLAQVNSTFDAVAADTPRWFQLDAGADFKELLAWACRSKLHLVTVRAAQDRRLIGSAHRLWDSLAAESVAFEYALIIPQGRKRQARTANMQVRYAPVNLALPVKDGHTQPNAPLWAVYVSETGTAPAGEEPIDWLLLTNCPVVSSIDAQRVIFGYTLRWRVEEFHRAWKEVCGVEDSQIPDAAHFIPWAVLLAAVAMRIERLKYLARNSPNMPASVEFAPDEIEALVLLKPKGLAAGAMPTIAQAVFWVAGLGGHMGSINSKRRPGTLVICRGLRLLNAHVSGIRNYKESLE